MKKSPNIELVYKKEVEKMIYYLFRVCDETVWLNDWAVFEKKFGEITQKFGFDLYKIYHGKTLAEMQSQYKKKNKNKGKLIALK